MVIEVATVVNNSLTEQHPWKCYPKCHFRPCILVLLLLIFVLPACERDVYKYPSHPYEPASADLIAEIRDKGWLDANCARADMTAPDYPICLRVKRTLMAPLDLSKRDEFGAFYDPKKYYDCRMGTRRNNTRCEIHALRRNEPEPVWPNPAAPPVDWPRAPEPIYRRGMSAEAYFKALCDSEAGQFIYRTVDDVEGIYQIRPRYKATDYQLQDPNVLEDPYHYNLAEPKSRGISLQGPGEYSYWESSLYEPEERWNRSTEERHESMYKKPSDEDNFIIYEGYNRKESSSTTKRYEKALTSRFGYVWRGIKRPNDRENFIAGGELAIVDLQTSEILAIWRGFARSRMNKRHQIWWPGSQVCPMTGSDGTLMANFIMNVLRPADSNTVTEDQALQTATQ